MNEKRTVNRISKLRKGILIEETKGEITNENVDQYLAEAEDTLKAAKAKFEKHKQEEHQGPNKGRQLTSCHKCGVYKSLIRMARLEYSEIKREKWKLEGRK